MAILSSLSIRNKFLLLPLLVVLCLVALGTVFMSARQGEYTLFSQITRQNLPKVQELSRLFSEFSTNHVKFINLLAGALKERAPEGAFYAQGRKNIMAVNKTISAMDRLGESYVLNAEQQRIATSLRQRLVEYRNKMGEAVLMSSVQIALIASVTLGANESYDAANADFLKLIDSVQRGTQAAILDAQNTHKENQRRFFAVMGVSIGFIVLLTLLLSYIFTSELRAIMTILRRLAQGDMDIPELTEKRRDEFGSLNQVVHSFRQALIQRDAVERHLKAEISERTRAEEALRKGEERFRMLYDDNPLMLITVDAKGSVLSVNRRGTSQLGYGSSELIGLSAFELVVEEDRVQDARMIKRCALNPGTKHQWSVRMCQKNGEVIWVRKTGQAIGAGKELVVLVACEDITETRLLAEKLSYQATHDELTGLVNRWEFERRVVRAVETSRNTAVEHVLCYIDMDQFKIVNDTCGHAAGDELLRQIAKAMEAHVRTRDTLARVGGDEFGLLLEHCSLSDGWRATRGLLKAIEEFKFAWNGRDFRIGASIGVVLINDFSTDTAEVMANADAACYTAKEQGRNRIHVHTDDDLQLRQRRGEMEWASRIPEALEANRFELYCQAIEPVNGMDGKGLHAEFLIRMKDEAGSIIAPGQFLPAAERYSLSVRVDRWVVAEAFSILKRARDQGNAVDLCSINLSGHSLGNEDFLEFVLGELKRSGVQPHNVCFEVTESAAIYNLESARFFITRLKQEGMKFSLDDFGTGLSSFAYLRELPVDFLKIDGVFIKEIVRDPIHLAMVRSINEVGHIMGMKTVAEFVESQEIMDKLREIGVDYAQGYHIGRPRPAAEVFSI